MALFRQEGSPLTDGDSDDPTVLRGLISIPIGSLQGLSGNSLGLGGQEGSPATDGDSADDDPTVLRGFVTSPLGLGHQWGLPGDTMPIGQATNTAMHSEPDGFITPDGRVFPGGESNAAVDLIFSDGFESGDTSAWVK